MLFSGTVRTNLDPYDRHADHELWEALSHVALKVGALVKLGQNRLFLAAHAV